MAQLFVKDRRTGALDLITPGIDGKGADEGVYRPSLSADGRYVVFESNASSLVPGDRNWKLDVFLFDRVRRTTRRLNVLPDGGESSWSAGSARLSDDGRLVVFASADPDLVPGVLPRWSPEEAFSHIFIRGPLH